MPSGTLQNLATSGFVRTPPAIAQRITTTLLTFSGPATVLDPTAGEGDLLLPLPQDCQIYGVEVSAERSAVAAMRLPDATILTSPIEQVRFRPAQFDAILANPPYFFQDGKRAEYRILRDIGPALKPGGILVAILPARSGWDQSMINHWLKWYSNIRCWTFPGTSFEQYTQIIVCGVRRAAEAPIDPVEQNRLKGWRYRTPRTSESPWVGGYAPPQLPTLPIADPYAVPMGGEPAAYRTLNASDELLLDAMAQSSVCHLSTWQEAMQPPIRSDTMQSIMPPSGKTHLAADILTGVLNHAIMNEQYLFSSKVDSSWITVDIDGDEMEEQNRRGVIRMSIRQLQDDMTLRVLNITTGAICGYTGEAAYRFLEPMLGGLIEEVLKRRKPLYQLTPHQWELATIMTIGTQKRLPRSTYSGLVPEQIHRVCGISRALNANRKAMYQGEPGVGKTVQSIALAAVQATIWRHPEYLHQEQQLLPRWRARLRQAWQHSPNAKAFLQGNATPHALPVLVVTPKRVTRTWLREIESSYPESTCVVIRSHRDIDLWMQQCACSEAPVVFGIVPHSLSRTFTHEWKPAVIACTSCSKRRNDSRTHYHCPGCQEIIVDYPSHPKKKKRKQDKREDDDAMEPVASIEFFEKKPRTCRNCQSPLWSRRRKTRNADPAKEKLCPYDYLYARYRGCVGLTIIDESHNGNGENTDIGHAMHMAQLAAQTYVYASGTHYGGTLDKLYHYLYRFSPQFWLRMGYRWKDIEQAIRNFGIIQEVTKEYEQDANKGTGATSTYTSVQPAPGISARIIPLLQIEMVYMSIHHMGAYMPDRIEVPVLVSMRDALLEERLREARGEQDTAQWIVRRNLAAAYKDIVEDLEEKSAKGNTAAAMAKGTIPRWFSVFPCAKKPYMVWQTKRNKWGHIEDLEKLLQCPVLSDQHLYPLEMQLRTLVKQHVDQEQRVMIYYEQSTERELGKRLEQVLQDLLEKPAWILPPSVEPDDREDAIRTAMASGRRVAIVPYRKVSEGLNLQDTIDVIIWFELAMNLFHLEQASRRAWRPGRIDPVTIYYMAYQGTAVHKKLIRLGAMSAAASALAGETPEGALIEQAKGDQTVLAKMSKSLDEARDALLARFRERDQERRGYLNQQGSDWLIPDPLPALLERLRSPIIDVDLIIAASAIEATPVIDVAQVIVERTPASVESAPVPATPAPAMRVAKYTLDDLIAEAKARNRITKKRPPKPLPTGDAPVGLWDAPLSTQFTLFGE